MNKKKITEKVTSSRPNSPDIPRLLRSSYGSRAMDGFHKFEKVNDSEVSDYAVALLFITRNNSFYVYGFNGRNPRNTVTC